MLESTLELADLLPPDLRQDLIAYEDEISQTLQTLADERQFQQVEAVLERAELIFLVKYLYEHLTEGDVHLDELFSVFHHVGISGFRIENETYIQQGNITEHFLGQTNDLRNGLRDLIRRTELGIYIFEIHSDEEIIERLFEEGGQ
jgi:hypothetical protein